MQTRNTGVVSSIPPRVTIKTPLVKKATGNHFIESTSLETTQCPVYGLCYTRNRVCNDAISWPTDSLSRVASSFKDGGQFI